MNNTENNELIAEFMGWIKQTNPDERWFGQWFDTFDRRNERLRFDTSWDWLMLVVDRIESIIVGENNSFNVTIGSTNYCVIQDSNGELFETIEDYGETKLETTYRAVVEFIKWYNNE